MKFGKCIDSLKNAIALIEDEPEDDRCQLCLGEGRVRFMKCIDDCAEYGYCPCRLPSQEAFAMFLHRDEWCKDAKKTS